MTYVALLRGINVGGNSKVEMSKLKQTFENLALKNVKTYINSGNVIFLTDEPDRTNLVAKLERAIKQDFGLDIRVLVKTLPEIETIASAIPATWLNNDVMRCDVMFLWPEMDSPDVIKFFPYKAEIEDISYVSGAVVWRIDRDKVRRGAVPKIIGSDVYKQLTIRNVNTLRKLLALMQAE